MSELEKFNTLAHIFISLIGSILLLALWVNIRRKFKNILENDDSPTRVDRSLLNIALAIFVWVLSGVWTYIGYQFQFYESILYLIGVNLFSVVNNLLLLLALFYFYYAPGFIYNNRETRKILVILAFGVFFLSVIVTIWFFNTTVYGIKIANLPDFIFSIILSILLVVTLYKTFVARGLNIVAFISVASIGLIIFSQLPEVFIGLNDGFINHLIQLIAKTALIGVFLVLATAWVIQLATMPKSNEIHIIFKDWSLIQLTIPSKNMEKVIIDFGSKTTQYNNLLKFAIRRKFGESNAQSILIGNGGEIKSQTYLSRIIDNINTISDSDLGELERRDLFTFIGQGKYRLRILPENIKIDSALLNEFVHLQEFEEYKIISSKN
jgi:hypothetical protein